MVASRRPRALLGAALLALPLAACAPEYNHPRQPQLIQILEGLDHIQHAMLRVAHQGERVVTSYSELTGSPTFTQFSERITTDGLGHFAIEPLQAYTPTDPPNPVDFLLLQQSREGFIFRYRDFLIRNIDLVLKNYRVVEVTYGVVIAGRDCVQIELQRILNAPGVQPRTHLVAFDIQTGIVLRYGELDQQRVELASLEYLTFTETPNFNGVQFHVPSNKESRLDLGGDVLVSLGFEPWLPKSLPPGYQLMEATRVVDHEGRPWAKLTYTDGIEVLFFMHGGRTPTESEVLSTNPTSKEIGIQAVPGQVGAFQAGAVTVLQGTIASNDVIAMGEVPPVALLQMLESALPD